MMNAQARRTAPATQPAVNPYLRTKAAADAWMVAEKAAERAIGPLKAEVEQLHQFVDGLLVVLVNVVPAVLRGMPELAAQVQPHWAMASERWEALDAGGPRLGPDESLELLEARKLLFRACNVVQAWPGDRRLRE